MRLPRAIGRARQWSPVRPDSARKDGAEPRKRGDGRSRPRSLAEEYLREARSRGDSPVVINQQINRHYISFGLDLQRVMDPSFQFDHATGALLPNWFPIAFHVSSTVGDSIQGALAGLELIEEMQTGKLVNEEGALANLGLPNGSGWVRSALRLLLNLLDVPYDLGVVVFAALRMNYGVLWNPATIVTSVRRLRHLYELAPGDNELEKSRSILETTVDMLGTGNQGVFADIAPAVEAFIAWRRSEPGATGRDVLEGFSLPRTERHAARDLFELGCAQTGLRVDITPYASKAPLPSGRNLLLAGCALYQQASVERSKQRRESLVTAANALLALREQRDLLQPAFDAEQGGKDVFHLLTPMLRVHFGRVVWNYTSFQLDPTRGNWGLFDDRWPAIMAAFETLYRTPVEAWVFSEEFREHALTLHGTREP